MRKCLQYWERKKQTNNKQTKKKTTTHYYVYVRLYVHVVPTQTEEYCRSFISELKDLQQPKNLLQWLANQGLKVRKKEGSKFNFNSHCAPACLYHVYIAITICSFVKQIVYRIFCRRSGLIVTS